jgi:large subunit ribosomal protein L9e
MTVKKDDKGEYLELNTYLNTYKQAAILNTVKTHITNMVIGVTIGFRYKMVCVKKHFPITPNVLTEKGKIEIKNFIGKKENIMIPILPGVTVIKTNNPEGELWFEGNDKQNVSQNTSLVNQACNVGEKDKRQFLDGVYVSDRGLITSETK